MQNNWNFSEKEGTLRNIRANDNYHNYHIILVFTLIE